MSDEKILSSKELKKLSKAHIKVDKDGKLLIPPNGFVCYKRVLDLKNRSSLVIAKLHIPSDAKVVFPYVPNGKVERGVPINKARASKAIVLEIYRIRVKDNSKLKQIEEAHSMYLAENFGYLSFHNKSFTYKKGKVMEPSWFDDRTTVHCSAGINFFASLKEAAEFIM